jgi:hypothetical protein
LPVATAQSGSPPHSAHRCADAGTAGGDDRLREIDAVLGEGGGKRRIRLQVSVLDDLDERQVEAARHMAAAQTGAGLRRFAREALGRPRVDNL